jgi:acetoin utilization protein AcuB
VEGVKKAMSKELVKDWMTSDVITIEQSTTLPKAHELMISYKIRRLPVVGKENHLVGIITLGDVRGAEPSPATTLSVWELNYLLARLQVKEIMTGDVFTISPTATIGEAARLMLDKKVSGLPVTDERGTVIGIITESDIFRMVVRHEWRDEPAFA